MSEKYQIIGTERDLRPAYYDSFHCLMSDCKLSCCKDDWNISFGKKDYLTLKKQKGSPELNKRLEHCLRRVRGKNANEFNNYAKFVIENGQCPLLSENCLCTLQQEKGHKVLPEVCRDFPRIKLYSPTGYLDRALSPACEGVLALLWDLPQGIDFKSDPLPEHERQTGLYTEDNLLVPYAQDIRSICIDILQNRRFSLPERILLLGMALKPLAEGQTDLPAWLEKAQALAESPAVGDMLASQEQDKTLPLFLTNNINMLFSPKNHSTNSLTLQLIAKSWLKLEFQDETFQLETDPYLQAKERFAKQFGSREYFMENLMVSVFFYLGFPKVDSPERLWKSYLDFCTLYSMYRFAAVMSCREDSPGDKNELFQLLVHVSRFFLHRIDGRAYLQESLLKNDSASLGAMAILLSG